MKKIFFAILCLLTAQNLYAACASYTTVTPAFVDKTLVNGVVDKVVQVQPFFSAGTCALGPRYIEFASVTIETVNYTCIQVETSTIATTTEAMCISAHNEFTKTAQLAMLTGKKLNTCFSGNKMYVQNSTGACSVALALTN